MKKNNPYGYKIGYCENGSRLFNRLFITRSYNQALSICSYYRRYTKHERESNRPLINPFWQIAPITKKEILAGIWDEPPFGYLLKNNLSEWLSLHRVNPKVKPDGKILFHFHNSFSYKFFPCFCLTFGKHPFSKFYYYFTLCTFAPCRKG